MHYTIITPTCCPSVRTDNFTLRQKEWISKRIASRFYALFWVMRASRAGLQSLTRQKSVHRSRVYNLLCTATGLTPAMASRPRYRAADAASCWLQAVFEVGLAAESDPGVHKNSLVRSFEESLHWWLLARPEVSLEHTSIPHHIQKQCCQLHSTGLGDTCRPYPKGGRLQGLWGRKCA